MDEWSFDEKISQFFCFFDDDVDVEGVVLELLFCFVGDTAKDTFNLDYLDSVGHVSWLPPRCPSCFSTKPT